jgi:hypothetical protein
MPEEFCLPAKKTATARRLSLPKLRVGGIAVIFALGALPVFWPIGTLADTSTLDSKRHYWATSLTRTVDGNILQGLREAVARGEVGWLDVEPKFPVPLKVSGVNLIFYHVGGNCYIGSDCDRFPTSQPTGDRWGDEERTIDLNDAQARKIVVADLVKMVQRADQLAPKGATVGAHVDNIHNLDAEGLARIFNEYLEAVEAAKQRNLISKARAVGYVAKNNPEAFQKALEQKLLHVMPLYQINENAVLSQDGSLDGSSRVAQQIGRRFGIPVFLKTFGTDVAHTIEKGGRQLKVYASQEMTRQMAQLPNISGAAWSPDEARYQPTLFAQGAPVRYAALAYGNRAGKQPAN